MVDSDFQSARILVIDDQASNVRLLERLLEQMGLGSYVGCTDPREALDLFQGFAPDLVLLDLNMPHLSGLEVLAAIRDLHPREEYLPVLVLTGDLKPEAEREALSLGAKDFVSKPFRAMELKLRIFNLLETRFLHERLRQQNRGLEQLVRERTEAVEEARREVLERLTQAAEFRDDATGGHTRRVGELSALLAQALGLPDDHVDLIRRAAPLHDAGKIAIPDAILLKPGSLTPEEFEVMKSHTTLGAQMLSGGDTPLMEMAHRIALSHHERWDGTGYPSGTAGPDIPLEARIVSVADVYDALSSDRPYRKAWSSEQVVQEIRSLRGTHFDPEVADALLSLLAENPQKLSGTANVLELSDG